MANEFQRKDLAFSREDFFMGGPDQPEVPVEIRIEDGRVSRDVPEVFRVLYKFTNMLVQSFSQVDAERTQYLLSSNDTVKLYTFGRSVTVIALQAVIIDGRPKGARQNEDSRYSQEAYEQFMWLYEHELKMSASLRKNRRVVVRIKDHDHEVLCSSYSDGFASQGEWMVMVNIELIVLNGQLLGIGPAGKLKQGTSGQDILPTASRELLYNLALSSERTTPRPTGGSSSGGVASAVRRPVGPQPLDGI